MIDNFFSQARASYAEGLASLYTYERQIPEIAETKIQGLKKFYGVSSKEGLEFLEITSSSMNKPGRNTNEPGPLRIGRMYAGENFGIIRIDLERRKADIELHGLNEGVVLSKTLHFDKPVLTGKGL